MAAVIVPTATQVAASPAVVAEAAGAEPPAASAAAVQLHSLLLRPKL
jgi:hypothetical protein